MNRRMWLEMLAAMAVGMAVLGAASELAFAALGWSAALDRPDVQAMVMAADMSVAMVLWMRIRSRTWAGAGWMTAAMFLPFLLLLVPYWAGVLSGMAMLVAGHVLMLPCMAVAMARGHRAGHRTAGRPAPVGSAGRDRA